MPAFKFPETFKFGTATASLQIEGGDRNNSWFRWAEQGNILDGSHCIVACDHWNRVAEDIALMKDLNCSVYRMGLEWSRIEPAPGEFNKDAIAHYRDEIEQLLAAGIEPLVTLHHFSNPLWMEDDGAWTNSQAVDHFEKYCEYVVRHLGDLVSEWVTINEPNVYLAFGYIIGIWPPGEPNSIPKYFTAARNMIHAHIRGYKMLHKTRSEMGHQDTRVGVANHLRIFEPKNGSAIEKMSCRLHYRLFQDIFVAGMSEGRLMAPVGLGYPFGKGPFLDFMGINYYSRDVISGNFNPLKVFADLEVKEGRPVNDLGWEIYPEGLYEICRRYYQQYRVPIYITENGTCDRADAWRTQFLHDHLYQLHRAIADGIDVQRYYHWTLTDNFEWIEGFSARFGLIAVDFETQKRTIRDSGRFYSQICAEGGITEEMLKEIDG